MSTVLNVRGTNGSGKSTVVRDLMKHLGVISQIKDNSGKTWAYECGEKVFVLGRYETACGGLDTYKDFAQTRQSIRALIPLGHIVCEGVLWSTVFKQSDEVAREFPQHHFIFALLDTPAEICIQRVKARQEAKGKVKPFDEALLLDKIEQITRRQAALKEAGWDTRTLPWLSAFPVVCEWLTNEGVLKPREEMGQ
jgi:thymidylate kinase